MRSFQQGLESLQKPAQVTKVSMATKQKIVDLSLFNCSCKNFMSFIFEVENPKTNSTNRGCEFTDQGFF